MNEPAGARPDRRRYMRFAPKGTVNLMAGDHVQQGRLSNLSQGGMLMEVDAPAPAKLLGGVAEVMLRLDGQRGEWIGVSGRVVRLTPGAVALVFEDISSSLAQLIDEMATASRAHLRVLSVVMVDSEPSRRAAMAEAFRAAGCRVAETSTPLEAIVRLCEASFEPDLIAIADSSPSEVSEDLRLFVERQHPRAKMVTIGDELIEPVLPGDGDVDHWLSSARSDLESRGAGLPDPRPAGPPYRVMRVERSRW